MFRVQLCSTDIVFKACVIWMKKKKSCPEHKGNVCVNHQLPQLLKKKKKILPAEGVWFPVQIKAATGAASVKFHQLSKSETSRSFSLQLHQ